MRSFPSYAPGYTDKEYFIVSELLLLVAIDNTVALSILGSFVSRDLGVSLSSLTATSSSLAYPLKAYSCHRECGLDY